MSFSVFFFFFLVKIPKNKDEVFIFYCSYNLFSPQIDHGFSGVLNLLMPETLQSISAKISTYVLALRLDMTSSRRDCQL